MDKIFQPYNTLEELIANVDLGTLAMAANETVLQRWLAEHFYVDQAEALSIDRIKEFDGDELRLALCEELRIDLMSLSDYDTRAIERALARHRKKLIYIDPDTGDPDGTLVETQSQLMKLFGGRGSSVVYLCGGEFQIPLDKHSVTYIGRDGAVINIVSRKPINFDAAGITLRDVTLYLQYLTPNQIEIESSVNVKFVIGKRFALGTGIKQRDIYAFLQGRDAFESFASFERRAEDMRGIVVGEVLLDKSEFDITRNLFELHPHWRIDFLKTIRNFARDKFFFIFIDAENAARLFEIESRKQLIFADFGTDGSDAAIKVLYLYTETLGKILILLTDKPIELAEDAFAGSGSGGAGYGLELIAEFRSGVQSE